MTAILLVDGPLPGGDADIEAALEFWFPGAADPLDLDSARGQAMLLRADIMDLSQVSAVDGPLPGGDNDIEVALEWAWPGRRRTIYPAATIGRTSAPDDTPANTVVPPALQGQVNYGLSLFADVDPASAGSSSGGSLVLNDPAGELDGLVALCWDGAAIDILRGPPAAAFSTWSRAARLSSAGMNYDIRTKQLRMRDLGWPLANAELHGNRYGGTGGYDGDITLLGAIRPIAFGQVFNITPVQLGAVLLIYEVSCTSVRAITAVKDGGAALTFAADYPTYAALAAATLAGGFYATCLALGLFRLGGAPAKRVTADVQGDNDTIGAIAYPATRGQIARRIATGRGMIRLDDSSQIDFAALAALEARQNAPCGWYFDQPISKAAALDRVMKGCLGWWTMRLTGQLALGQVDDISTAPWAVVRFPEDMLREPLMQSYSAPRQATYVDWQKNYTPQAQDQLVGAVDQPTAAVLGAPAQYCSELALWLGRAWPTAPIASVDDSGYAFQADAALEAIRQQRILGVRRERWQMPVRMDPYADVIGRVVKCTGWSRFGFAGARSGLCVGVDVKGNNEVTLDLFM